MQCVHAEYYNVICLKYKTNYTILTFNFTRQEKMAGLEQNYLKDGVVSSYIEQPQDTRLEQLADVNVGLATYGLPPEEVDAVVAQAQEIGFTPLRWGQVVASVDYVLGAEGVELPAGKKAKQERGRIVEEALNKVTLERDTDTNTLRMLYSSEPDAEPIDLAQQVDLSDEQTQARVSELSADQMVFGKVLGYVGNYVKTQRGLAVEQTGVGQINIGKGPRIVVQGAGEGTRVDTKKADKVVTATSHEVVRTGLMMETVRQVANERRRDTLREHYQNRELLTTPKFTYDKWPTDPLMAQLRATVSPITDRYVAENGVVCDSKDLKYQTLFRLTTHDVAELFVDGQELEEYLIAQGAYTNWRNILGVDPDFVRQFQVNPDILAATIEEQRAVIDHRLEDSTLPLDEILQQSGIFAEPGWVIQKKDNQVYAVQEDTATSLSGAMPLEFREVDPELANAFHRDLHYIHTPRADRAFALFVQGEEMPFSVLALEQIDRPYKANALLFQGYDPKKCYDLTRLYSKPGTPGNTSSSMFSLTFNFLRSNTDAQAILSSFMPSYATGISMTSGGMDDPVLIKPLLHRFVGTEVGGQTVYEQMTNRRLASATGKVIRSRVPLLPTVELMCRIQNPRYQPLPGADTQMLEVF